MKKSVMLAVTILVSLLVVLPRNAAKADSAQDAQIDNTNANEGDRFDFGENPCAPPSHISGSLEETAWRLWVAATCPVNQNQYPYVVWENWLEQAQMYPPDPGNGLHVPNSVANLSVASHLLHASPLTLTKTPGLGATIPGLLGGADQNCNKAGKPPANQPNLIICEEVRESGANEDYIAGNGFWNRGGQQAAASSHANIEFPKAAVEVKVDWIELSTIGLDCGHLPAGFSQSIHVEMINGNCFALAGIHLMSKLLNNWIWATFEPQNFTTNPNRCKVLGCNDSFGSVPARTRGAETRLTQRLAHLMTVAQLAPEWRNYRLDGVQVFFTNNSKPTLLGSSIIEGENVGMPLTESSCISCHAVSSIKKDGTDGIQFLQNNNPVGNPEPLPSQDWIRRDFVWSLSLACPDSRFQTCTP